MKIIDCVQYSPEWWDARKGIPTASSFDKLITPGGKPSAQAKQYMYELIDACVSQEEQESFEPSEWMIRGTILEEEARDWFSMDRGKEVEQVGFITNDAGTAGCSPDGILDEGHGLEIKCPKGSTHVGYLLNGGLPDFYKSQIHGSLLVTGFSKWTFCSYHPNYRPLIVEVRPDEYTWSLKVALDKFVVDLKAAKARILK